MEFSLKARAAALIVVPLALAALPAALASAAPFSRSAYRVQKAGCARARSPHDAVCAALHLIPASSVRASARGAGGAPGVRAARNKEPIPGSLTPQELHAAYELPSETALSGTQTIAVVDAFNDPTAEADLAVYDKQFGLPECTKANGCFRKLDQEGRESPLPRNEGGWATEITIDVQMAHAICQNCHILLVEADGEENSELSAAVTTAFEAGATEISNSYGSIGLESELASEERGLNSAYDHPGVVITASSGDCGYRDQHNPEGAGQCEGLSGNVEFPAASPDVVAVGGTSLTDEGAWKSTVWGNSGGGCSSVFSAQPWQEAVSNWKATHCDSDRLSVDVAAEGDPYTGVAVYDGTPERSGVRAEEWTVYGGTSVASPIVAAEYALAGGAHGVSFPAQSLYRHIGEGGALYDVTSGENGSCANASCAAAIGYDGPSGVGSPLGLMAFAASTATPKNSGAPGVPGGAEVGETLRVSPGSWSNSPTSELYQWEDCSATGSECLPIQGASADTYTVASSDAGFSLRVMETASNAEGFGAPAFSEHTTVVPKAPPAPFIDSLSPKAGVPGTLVTINGTSFVNVTAVSFGSQPAKHYETLNEGQISAEAPEGTGTVLVTVTTKYGESQTVKRVSKAKFRFKKPKG